MGRTLKVNIELSDVSRVDKINRNQNDTPGEVIDEFFGFINYKGNANDYVLMRADGTALRDRETLGQAGIQNHDTLLVMSRTAAPVVPQPSPVQAPSQRIMEPAGRGQGSGDRSTSYEISSGGKIFLGFLGFMILVVFLLANQQSDSYGGSQTEYSPPEPIEEPAAVQPPKKELPPEVPRLVSPINEELQKNQPIVLRWEAVPDAVQYSVKVYNAQGEEIVLNHQSGTSYEMNKVRVVTMEGEIFWAVLARDIKKRESGWSDWVKFRIADSGGAPSGSDSENGQKPEPPGETRGANPPEVYLPFPGDESCAPSRLHVGDKAYVKPEARSLYVRCYPDTHPSNNILYSVKPSEEVNIIGGPECNYGWILWQVRCDGNREWRDAVCQGYHSCWIAETDKGDEFWLEPVSGSVAPISPTVSTECADVRYVKLYVGARGKIVFSDVTLRTSPKVPDDDAKANRIVILKRGDTLKVIGGPACAHNGTWWQVDTDSGYSGWVRELQPDKRLVDLE